VAATNESKWVKCGFAADIANMRPSRRNAVPCTFPIPPRAFMRRPKYELGSFAMRLVPFHARAFKTAVYRTYSIQDDGIAGRMTGPIAFKMRKMESALFCTTIYNCKFGQTAIGE
jgi:hypothetical protein